MARRSQTFGARTDDVDAQAPSSAQPASGVGLLFMCFNSEIDNQFAFTQSAWADSAGFPFNLPAGRRSRASIRSSARARGRRPSAR